MLWEHLFIFNLSVIYVFISHIYEFILYFLCFFSFSVFFSFSLPSFHPSIHPSISPSFRAVSDHLAWIHTDHLAWTMCA